MGPYSDYTLLERHRLLHQRVHTLEGMVRAYGMEVERTVEPSEVDWDFYETCEDPYELMDRNRLLEDRVDALEAIRAYCHEVARGVDRSEITKDRYAAYEHACTLLGIHTAEASEREAPEGGQEPYTERYKGYTLTALIGFQGLRLQHCPRSTTPF